MMKRHRDDDILEFDVAVEDFVAVAVDQKQFHALQLWQESFALMTAVTKKQEVAEQVVDEMMDDEY